MKAQLLSLLTRACRGIFLLGLISLSTNAEEPKPCTAKEYRQFDFWIGTWEVKDKAGKVLGHNNILPILNGCALSENWKSLSGSSGVSYNFYDQAGEKWHQTWIDQKGNPLYLNGKFKNGKMVLWGSRPGKEGSKVKHRITWTPLKDGSIKQHWQMMKDGGKSWGDVFVGFYTKKQ